MFDNFLFNLETRVKQQIILTTTSETSVQDLTLELSFKCEEKLRWY